MPLEYPPFLPPCSRLSLTPGRPLGFSLSPHAHDFTLWRSPLPPPTLPSHAPAMCAGAWNAECVGGASASSGAAGAAAAQAAVAVVVEGTGETGEGGGTGEARGAQGDAQGGGLGGGQGGGQWVLEAGGLHGRRVKQMQEKQQQQQQQQQQQRIRQPGQGSQQQSPQQSVQQQEQAAQEQQVAQQQQRMQLGAQEAHLGQQAASERLSEHGISGTHADIPTSSRVQPLNGLSLQGMQHRGRGHQQRDREGVAGWQWNCVEMEGEGRMGGGQDGAGASPQPCSQPPVFTSGRRRRADDPLLGSTSKRAMCASAPLLPAATHVTAASRPADAGFRHINAAAMPAATAALHPLAADTNDSRGIAGGMAGCVAGGTAGGMAAGVGASNAAVNSDSAAARQAGVAAEERDHSSSAGDGADESNVAPTAEAASEAETQPGLSSTSVGASARDYSEGVHEGPGLASPNLSPPNVSPLNLSHNHHVNGTGGRRGQEGRRSGNGSMPNRVSVAGDSLGAGGRAGRVVGEGMLRQQGGGVGIREEERGEEAAGASGVVARVLNPGPGRTTAAMGWRGGASGTLAQVCFFFEMALFTHYPPCCGSTHVHVHAVQGCGMRLIRRRIGIYSPFPCRRLWFQPRAHARCMRRQHASYSEAPHYVFFLALSQAVGPPTCVCTLYEDASAYLLLVSLPHCNLSCLRVTWRNAGAAGIVKISCAAIFPPPSVSRSGRTFRQVSRSQWPGEHCPVGPFEREVQLPQRIPENADVAASVSADGSGIELLMPKLMAVTEEREVRVLLPGLQRT
ncbi:unnamed protein product [Closterium sp. NIES-65]|nr:unnamed protein product [Closterium sp. NIES-65]